MNRTKISDESLYLSIICLVTVTALIPIALCGIPNTTDLPQHFRFAQTYYDSLVNGYGYPSWASEENFGYGDIGIRFYPPLEYFFLAFLRMLTGNWYDATRLNFLFWMMTGSLGIYFWAKSWLTSKESAVAACLYAFVPVHLMQLYSDFNNYSELAGTTILVFCFAFLTRIFKHGKNSDVLGLAVSFALLILTHLPLTIIGSLSFSVYALTLMRKKDFFQTAVKSGIGFGIGLAASAFYWVGLISEMKWLNHSSDKFSSGYYSYKNGFFPFSYYTDAFITKYYYVIADISLVLSLTFLASPLIYLFYKNQHKYNEGADNQTQAVLRTVLPLGLFAFFMVTPLSTPVWEIFTPLQKVQFPLRWLSIVAMCGAISTSAAIHYLLKGNFLKQRIWVYGCLIVPLVIATFNFIYVMNPTAFVALDREKFTSKLDALPETHSFDCWWTAWAKKEAFNTKEKISVPARQSEVLSWKSEERIFKVSEGNGQVARIATFYYPNWQATVNNEPVNIEKDENGVILIPLTSRESVIKLYFQESLVIEAASVLSLLIWLLVGAALPFLSYKKLFSSGKVTESFKTAYAVNS